MNTPSGENVTQVEDMRRAEYFRCQRISPVTAFHNTIVRSVRDAAIRVLSGENAIHVA